jgi:hypothetical protein
MRITKLLLLPLILALPTGVYFSQSNKTVVADLSGTWEVDLGRSGFAKSKNSSPEQIKITHHDPQLTIRRMVKGDGVQEEREFTYYTDGRGETNPAAWLGTDSSLESWRPSEIRSTTIWDKDKVVTRSVRMSIGGSAVYQADASDEWRLSSDGKTLTEITRTVPNQDLKGNAAVSNGTNSKLVYKLISK